MPSDPSATSTLPDLSGERPLEAGRAAIALVELHRGVALRLAKEGAAVQAFQELVRASRVVPMSPRLAATISLLALRAGTFGPALTLLSQGLDETEGEQRVGVMRLLSRLARRSGDLERAREVLVLLLAERPGDRRARAVLNLLLEREERWEELDGSLEKETREAVRRGAALTASGVALRRARLWDTRLQDPARAALRAMQAAQFAEQGGDFQRACAARLLWLRALHRSGAPARALEAAAGSTLASAEQAGRRAQALDLLDELGLPRPAPARAGGAALVARRPTRPAPVVTAPGRARRARPDEPAARVVEERRARAVEPPGAGPVEPGTQELPLGDPAEEFAPSFGPSPARALDAERAALFERVRGSPLDADGYRLLAEHFDTADEPARSSLMLELGRALEGDPNAAPRTPRLVLDERDRAGLQHAALRGEAGELLGLVAPALCALHAAQGREAGGARFHLEAGRGAKAAAGALLAAVRILGVRAPDVHLALDGGAPFALVWAGGPRLLVGRQAVKRELDAAQLRFFAGRALFTQRPELLALRNLRREQLQHGLALVADVAAGRRGGEQARVVREAIAGRAWERVGELLRAEAPHLDLVGLADAARSSANRAGLVVCGGVAPALAALRSKKALPAETLELVRFAASERYLQLRSRIP